MGLAEPVRQALSGLLMIEQELLLFAGFWVLVGTVDELAVDCCWLWFRLTGRARTGTISRDEAQAPLRGKAAIFIAAWQEDQVIGHTIRHALSAWQQDDFTLYVGCYGNDPATVTAAIEGADTDPRIRVIIHERAGPTTKADCLNRLYRALCDDEKRSGRAFRCVILHDSEDMVHAAELAVVDAGLVSADFVQLPVRPEPQPASRWVGGHYLDEFTEAHTKSLVVRDGLGAAIPAAGVGCGFARDMLERIARSRLAAGNPGPFAAECLTEDYELGVLVSRAGGRSRFLRVRDAQGDLVATRAYFPARFRESIRQKTRWIHGIAFQGWERLGWEGGGADTWMALRDRRGPLTAIVLACSYALILVEGVLGVPRIFGWSASMPPPPILGWMIAIGLFSLIWRSLMRALFTGREYGLAQGFWAILRIPVANYIAIMAGRDALSSYVKTLRGGQVTWDKTRHDAHPAAAGGVLAA
ncbi:glycosyl transferase family protein [Novosphingobium lindaniclasticum]|jgi:adsorption protein B|uniref:glycosyl transferase family protein n=1 Tax=Novosphingobium lindaniclasticum TaxID=1329895 RepID=UPI00240A0335|nr:glycosyl transferase family protein [Novosphingobium lindaniclasticum]